MKTQSWVKVQEESNLCEGMDSGFHLFTVCVGVHVCIHASMRVWYG